MPKAERIYRRLMIILPRELRREAEPDLLEVFRDGHARAAARGAGATVRFWFWTIADLFATSLGERLSPAIAVLPDAGTPTRSIVMRILQAAANTAADVRFAARRLAATPGWTMVASGTLALGLAVSLVAGILMRDVLLRPLPFPNPDRLVRLIEQSENGFMWWPSYPNARDWREHGHMFSTVAIVGTPRMEPVLMAGSAVRVPVARAGNDFFQLLGVRPVEGRLFTAEEHRPGGAPVAIVSERFWRGELQGTPISMVPLTIGTISYTIVGVLPNSLQFLNEEGRWGRPADVWTPLERETRLGRRTSHGEYHVVARLRDGVTLEQAAADLTALARTLKAQHQEPTQADNVVATPLQEVVIRRAREPLRLLMAAGLAVLLVACLNLAAAILAQGLNRMRELDIRQSLGATRSRLAAHLLAGAGALALPGTVIGLVLAVAGLRTVKAVAAGSWPRLEEAALDWQAVLVAFATAALTAGIAGLLPAILLSRRAAADRLRTRGGTATSREARIWTGFVTVQVALTLLLLVGAGLLVRSFNAAMHVDLGYDSRDVLAVDVTLPLGPYDAPERRGAFYTDALARLRSIPGVAAVGLTSVLPHASTAYTASTSVEGSTAKPVMAGYRIVDPGYFAALRIPHSQEALGALERGEALVDRRLEQLLWNGTLRAGDRVRSSFAIDVLPVAGTVGTVREWHQEDDAVGAVYADYRRQPIAAMHVVVRSHPGQLATVADGVRRALAAMDTRVPVRIEPLAGRVAGELDGRRLLLLLASGFGVTALFLAAAGVHAMIAFAVSRQLRDAAIRLALGARPTEIGRRVVLRGLMPAVIGALIGLALTIPMGDAVRAQLFKVTPTDPLVLAGAATAILLAALGAAAFPARRAARVDPAAALRQE
jgi:putative ABC transport system permease protein